MRFYIALCSPIETAIAAGESSLFFEINSRRSASRDNLK
jgi:hypothetical protein